MIHELTGPVIPTVIPGVHAVHAVDAAGVHPLLLAIGSERYVPYAGRRKPQELLTSANAILGQGQLSLAKYLLIVAREDDPQLDIHDIAAFFAHLLERVDWQHDLHFQTCTTIDTLDYSGSGLNEGSKLVIAAAGPPRRTLPTQLPADLRCPTAFATRGSACRACWRSTGRRSFAAKGGDRAGCRAILRRVSARRSAQSRFRWWWWSTTANSPPGSLNNFLWMTFTRSNPAADVSRHRRVRPRQKHWGCRGSLVIDARIKPHHAPPLVEDPAVSKSVDRTGGPGGPLHGII